MVQIPLGVGLVGDSIGGPIRTDFGARGANYTSCNQHTYCNYHQDFIQWEGGGKLSPPNCPAPRGVARILK